MKTTDKKKRSTKSKRQDNKLVDLSAARRKRVEERRKNVERILFRNLMGVYSVIEDRGLVGVQLVDISREGMAFQFPWRPGEEIAYSQGESVLLRLYFGQETFLPAEVEIRHCQEVVEGGQTYMRFGGKLNKDLSSFKALNSFIEFIYQYAEFAKPEDGQIKLLFV
jgi:hypothetical protein